MDNVAKIADIVFKGVAAFAGLVVVIIASHFQSAQTAATLQSQREQADSSLRASMFSYLINPIVGPQKDEMDIDRQRLLVELLALNFNESLSLKPLMVDIDKRLAQKEHAEQAETYRGSRESLRASAQLIAQRQLALLTKGRWDSEPQKQIKDQTCIYRIELSIADDEKKESLPASKSPSCFAAYTSFFDDLLEVHSPNGLYSLLFTIHPEAWEDQSFRVTTIIDSKEEATKKFINMGSASPPPAKQPVSTVEFHLTWFDFPFTENTILADGTRFALIIDQVAEKDHKAVFSLIWFQNDYFSLRERPINYSKFRDDLGLK
jgi:hypothetical protein